MLGAKSRAFCVQIIRNLSLDLRSIKGGYDEHISVSGAPQQDTTSLPCVPRPPTAAGTPQSPHWVVIGLAR